MTAININIARCTHRHRSSHPVLCDAAVQVSAVLSHLRAIPPPLRPHPPTHPPRQASRAGNHPLHQIPTDDRRNNVQSIQSNSLSLLQGLAFPPRPLHSSAMLGQGTTHWQLVARDRNPHYCVQCRDARRRCEGTPPKPCPRCLERNIQCKYIVKPTKEDIITLKGILDDLQHLDLNGLVVGKQLVLSKPTGTCDLHVAWSERHHLKVAVKRVLDVESFGVLKRAGRELSVWSDLQDENILALLGYLVEGSYLVPSTVSEWMERGSLDNFMKTLPRGGEESCILLTDVSSGIAYLHSRDIVHGDISASNVLVSDKNIAKISSFALSRKRSEGISESKEEASPQGSQRWMAPELVLDFTGITSKMSDIWALGMVGYELLSWQIPYFAISEIAALSAIAHGNLPEKPENSENTMIFSMLWTVCTLCWKEKSSRPTAAEIAALLRPQSTNRSKLDTSSLSATSLHEEMAHIDVTNAHEPVPNRPHFVKESLASLSHLDVAGSILRMKQQEWKAGGYSDVYSAWSTKHNMKVAVKKVRGILKKDVSFMKRFVNEIRIWAKLEHENVLPLQGFYFEGEELMPNLVSEWMEDGTLDEYVIELPLCCSETVALLRGISAGLAYLHSKKIIHGDLKGSNILISSKKAPLLADFGLSLALQKTLTIIATSSTSSNNDCKGSLRWMAPELLIVVDGESPTLNEMTDVWALGMVAYELLSGDIPYANVKNDFAVMPIIQKKIIPVKPSEAGDLTIYEKIWNFCCSCWNFDCASRPSSEQAALLWSS
ncbi:kinase-like protein [Schizopora paradoxa]|uniref:Kinase-like protein n=1 Tax=Schizopora paradoxa TaxID=27342 RepID=A0A0H2RG32_9AGAM|nr:kinase-like protein [Schizopora paradoxa]